MKALEDTIIYLIKTQPFYAHLLSKLNPIEDEKVPICGFSIQSGKIYLHINAFVFNQLTLENKARIVIHEMLHIISNHSLRQRNKNKEIWNIACDVAVNQMIEGIPIKQKVQFSLGGESLGKNRIEREIGGLTPENVILPDGTRITLHHNGFAEEYYNILIKENPSQSGQREKKLNIQNQNNEDKEINSGSYSDDNGQNNENEEMGIQPSGKASENLGNLGSNLHPTWSDSNSTSEDFAKEVVKNAVNDAIKRAQGNVPSNIKVHLEALMESRLPWKRILKMFLAKQAYNSRYLTFKKPNKRFIDEGLPGYKKQKSLNIIVAIDTSGSIREKDMQEFSSEIINIQRTGANIKIIECDCEIKKAYDLKRKLNPEFTGRGGTDFRPVWNYISERRLRPDAIIYFTDGLGQAPESSKYPTLWTLTSNGELPWMKTDTGTKPINWGKSIKISSN